MSVARAWRISSSLIVLFGSILLGGLAGCREEPEPEPAPTVDATTYLPLRLGAQTVQAQLAITAREQRRGLMHREELAPDAGMLFLYEAPQRMGFWMMNTKIDLDIGFFDPTGHLLEVHTMFAGDTTTTRSRSENVQFALEMNRGWFQANGIAPGTQLDLDDLRAALIARGYAPKTYLP